MKGLKMFFGRDELNDAFATALWQCALKVNPDVNWRSLTTMNNARWGWWAQKDSHPSPASLKKVYGLTVEEFCALRALTYGDTLK